MPSSRTERIVFGIGLGLIAAMAVLLLPALKSYGDAGDGDASILARSSSPPPPAPVVRKRPAAPAAARQTSFRAVVVQAQAAPATTPAAKAPAVAAVPPKLRLAATKGDCWISVRNGSSTGPELYVGTLAKGKSLSFRLGTLWIRIGAPQNLDAFIGKKKTTLPTSSFNVIVTRTAVRPAPES